MEAVMRSRLVVLTLCLYLISSLPGCSHKPPPEATNETNKGNQPTTAQPANSSAGKTGMADRRSPETAKPLVVPAGTILPVRLGHPVGPKTTQSGQTLSPTVA